MTHPHLQLASFLPDPFEQFSPSSQSQGRHPVLPSLPSNHLSSQEVTHQLHPVTNPQNRNSQVQDRGITMRSFPFVNAGWTSGQNDPLGTKGPHLLHGHRVGMNLTVDFTLPDPSRNQLGVLGAEIEDENLVKLPALPTAGSAGLPGNDLFFDIVPLPACRQAGTPPTVRGLRGTLRSKDVCLSIKVSLSIEFWG